MQDQVPFCFKSFSFFIFKETPEHFSFFLVMCICNPGPFEVREEEREKRGACPLLALLEKVVPHPNPPKPREGRGKYR